MIPLRTLFLTAIFLVAASASGGAQTAAGKKIFAAQKCQACHYTDGPAKEKSIADQLAKKGPELWYAGSKFQKAWLEGWLADPQPIRMMAYNSLSATNTGNHPRLSAGEAAAVTEFLMGLTSKAVKPGVIKAKRNLKGKLVFTKKSACNACHRFPQRRGAAGGRSGPSLVGARQRLNPDWIFAYLMNPRVFKPVKAMPTFAGNLSEKDLKNVATFIANFK